MTPRRMIVIPAIAAATLAAMWFTFAFTMAMVTARTDPRAAIAWWPVDQAKAGAAAALLATQPAPAQAVQAEALALAVLARTPVSAEAARDVAVARAARGNLVGARTVIALGERLSRRDMPTQIWLIEDRVQAGDITGALVHYDRAMRTQKESRALLLPILAQAANDPAVARPLAARLTARPEWWSDFLGQFIATATSPDAIRLIADGLRLNPASDVDHARFVQIVARLSMLGDYGLARSLYDRMMGGDATPLVDGGFERDRGVPPLDWQLIDETDRSAVREPRDGAQGNALSIAGTEGKEVARQLLVLSPGRWRLRATSGAVDKNMLSPPTVSIACVKGGGAALAVANFPTGPRTPGWTTTFAVPPDCVGQWLIIGSASNVGYLTERAWIDDVAIEPATSAVSPSKRLAPVHTPTTRSAR